MFEQFKMQVEQKIDQTIEEMGEKNLLKEACEYALKSKGKRLRPIFVLMIADAIGLNLNVIDAALSVEFFHTASLIADDLPCMDNDDERRDRPSLHRVFDESIALLASYTFIAMGYDGIAKNCRKMKAHPSFNKQAEKTAVLALEIASRCGGMQGATHGQFLDLFPPNHELKTILKIIEQKTVTLFQLSFAFGWLFGGGDPQQIDEVQKVASHLGMAFQIADDLQDLSQDEMQEGEVNIVKILGREKTLALFSTEINQFIEGLKKLNLWNENFEKSVDFLINTIGLCLKPTKGL